MKQTISILFLSLCLALTFACAPKSTSNPSGTSTENNFANQAGTVKMFVCSRGCYQYVIETQVKGSTKRLSPTSLDDAYKVPDLAIRFDGALLSEFAEINKPGADDRPVLDFKAQKVQITKMAAGH